MVESGDERARGAAEHGYLRASDADRERVIDTLKAAFVQGRLAKDELDARVARALASRTYADLDALTSDIPAGLAGPQPSPGPAPVPGQAAAQPAPVPGRAVADAKARRRERAIIATALFAAVAFLAALSAGNPLAGLLGLWALGSALVSLLMAGNYLRGARRDRRSGGGLPPPRAISTGPGAGCPAAPAAPSRQLPSAKPRRPGQTDAGASQVLRPRLSS
jgi:hypothetical protein